jgi:hypothetical protein
LANAVFLKKPDFGGKTDMKKLIVWTITVAVLIVMTSVMAVADQSKQASAPVPTALTAQAQQDLTIAQKSTLVSNINPSVVTSAIMTTSTADLVEGMAINQTQVYTLSTRQEMAQSNSTAKAGMTKEEGTLKEATSAAAHLPQYAKTMGTQTGAGQTAKAGHTLVT